MMVNLEEIKVLYEPLADEGDAHIMSRYMKNQFSFFGIKKKGSASVNRQLFKEFGLSEGYELNCLVQSHFQEDERKYHCWWYSLDDLSPNRAGFIVGQGNDGERARMIKWVHADNFWLQRAGLLHPLKFKEKSTELSPLSSREALKWLTARGADR
ncbi:DNA alkylation repair protein [Macrococcus carouselicus]|uniref:Uncharacterized protein n=1 Tax=Macrococcus carouselicus TaxID=69969 RepID=A0A9Q8CKY7_9STAP|nr:DNA alkylation repair protein [Macrococcus carouselicus]TDM02514.1 hypothetical protein ERX40_08135 [Macrococcus carouselicus]